MTSTVGHCQYRRAPFGERRVMSARFLGRRASRTLRIAVTLGVLWQALSLAAAVPPAYAALPDNRAYELVSPPTEGEPYLPATLAGPEREEGFSTSLAFRAGAGGEAVVYTGEPGVSTGTGSIGPGLGNQWYVARTATGWLAEDITPSNSSRQGAYQSFSDDLATGFYEGEKTPLTEDVEPGCVALYSRASAGGIFTSLFTAGETPRHCGKPLFAGAADGGSPVIFQSEAALAPGSEAATEVPPPNVEGQDQGLGESCLYGCNLYESIGGHLRTVNVLEGKPVPGATFGGYGPTAGEAPNFANAISSDGSRIFWTDTLKGPNMEHVYVLEDGTSNVAVSSGQPAEYWGASPDGHYAFYTEVGRLWRFDSRANEREPLTPEGAGAQGVVGINQTGEAGGYVYFVASAVLAGEPNARGEHATPGGFNLYLLHADATTFIAGLASEDNELLVKREQHNHGGAWRGGLGERVAEVTPDGRHLAFQSVRELTGYNSGRSNLPEVFVYAAASAQLTCASCSPTGAPFASVVGEGLESKVPVSAGAQTYVERWLSEDGNRVFFSSPAPLTPEDTNAAVDVYEWERPAAPGEPNNTCTAVRSCSRVAPRTVPPPCSLMRTLPATTCSSSISASWGRWKLLSTTTSCMTRG
jgi:hypothetical protein